MSVIRKENVPESLKQYESIFHVINIVSHKWTVFILLSLDQPRHFNELQNMLDISHSVLGKELRDMQQLKLIRKTVLSDSNPPSTEYSLSYYGKLLLDEFTDMLKWSVQYEQKIVSDHLTPR